MNDHKSGLALGARTIPFPESNAYAAGDFELAIYSVATGKWGLILA